MKIDRKNRQEAQKCVKEGHQTGKAIPKRQVSLPSRYHHYEGIDLNRLEDLSPTRWGPARVGATRRLKHEQVGLSQHRAGPRPEGHINIPTGRLCPSDPMKKVAPLTLWMWVGFIVPVPTGLLHFRNRLTRVYDYKVPLNNAQPYTFEDPRRASDSPRKKATAILWPGAQPTT